MKPSEYIAKGIALRPNQVKYILVDEQSNGSCVMGALLEGYAGNMFLNDSTFATKHFKPLDLAMPWLRKMHKIGEWPLCPSCQAVFPTIVGTAVHLNNDHGWSRESIGKWLDQFAVDAETSENQKRAVTNLTPDKAEREEELEEVLV